jgi:hypothetical protein
MQARRLLGELLDLAVQIDRVLLQLRDVWIAVDRVHAPGRVPGRAGGQLIALEQQRIGAAELPQVVEHRAADHAAADHHHPGLRGHAQGSSLPISARR